MPVSAIRDSLAFPSVTALRRMIRQLLKTGYFNDCPHHVIVCIIAMLRNNVSAITILKHLFLVHKAIANLLLD